MFYTDTYESPLGQMTLLSDDNYLLGLWFSGQAYFGADYDLDLAKQVDSKPIEIAKEWLDDYFGGKKPDTKKVPLKPEVTEFRSKVLKIIESIDYGKTETYKEISDKLQNGSNIVTNKARAIGNAVGHNPILLIIPCHRVLGSDGSLTGYAGGIEKKKKLLAMEMENL